MISKETFVKTLTSLQDFERKVDAVDEALQAFGGGLFFPEPSEIIVELLSDIFNDDEEWIPYLLWEKNFLRDLDFGDITDANGETISITCWEDVYDFLVRSMKE